MTRGTAMLLAPRAVRFHALMTAGLPPRGLAVVLLLLALCVAVAVAVRLEGQR